MANPLTGNPYNPIYTAQQTPTTMISSGSVGTSDTSGTAEPIRWGGDPTSGAGYVKILGSVQTDTTPALLGTSYHIRGTTGAAVWGTIIAASGAGTKQYVSNVDIVVTAGTVDVAVTNIGVDGSTGAGVLVRGQFVPSGGIAKVFSPAMASGTNGTLAFWMGGAGTVDVTVNYRQGV